jgi:hypothetical protein
MNYKELEQLELTLTTLEHTKECPVRRALKLCECGLSEGRRRLYNYIDNKRMELRNEQNNAVTK